MTSPRGVLDELININLGTNLWYAELGGYFAIGSVTFHQN